MFIDQLEMIQEKTRGNLTNEEAMVLRNALSNLQMAFVEVSGGARPEPAHRGEGAPDTAAQPEPPPPAPSQPAEQPASGARRANTTDRIQPNPSQNRERNSPKATGHSSSQRRKLFSWCRFHDRTVWVYNGIRPKNSVYPLSGGYGHHETKSRNSHLQAKAVCITGESLPALVPGARSGMGRRLVAGVGHQFIRRCGARLRFHHSRQTRKDDLVYYTPRAGEMVCRDVEDFTRSDGLPVGDSTFREWRRMFCGCNLQPHQHGCCWRRVRDQIHGRCLQKIHAGLGEGIKPFFDYRTVAY